MSAGGKWIDRNSGPVVRPYALTGGRTEPAGGQLLDLIAVVVAASTADAGDPIHLSPEQRKILSLCQRPVTVADVASDTALPVGVIRVLLADLIAAGLLAVRPPRPTGEQPSSELLREVLHGLRAL
jgi:hypothetical protein